MKRIFILFFLWCCNVAQAQDSVLARVIFIGDAGEMDEQQKAIIPDAANHIITGKTTVLYLGDNVYPHGMALPDSKDEARTKAILQSQYQPMRAKGAPVYFIPGNHDWDRMGPQGLAKVKSAYDFLNSQNDSLLQQIPPNGCPDPVAINVSDSLVIIAMDSEWWLFPFDKDNADGDCTCNSTRDVIASLQELFYQNRYKTILLATHHPFQSYGTHGGYFSWKDHIFPLTAAQKNLYIPLPGIGSIYPLYRKIFSNPEDLHHPLYKDMIKNVDAVFKGFPNLIHISGHEHGLQMIDDTQTGAMQIVSGGGAKENYTIKGKYSLFGVAQQGYVVADWLPGNKMHFTFYVYKNDSITKAFEYDWKAQPYQTKEDSLYHAISSDSAIAMAHQAYWNDGRFYNFLFGKNYRQEWAQPVKLPVIRASALGLSPMKLGGGFQSTSLRMEDKEGKQFTLRTVEKKPDLIVPLAFRGTFVRELLDDATSAQHPYSATMVDAVATATGVPHATPTIGVVSADTALGQYNKLFEGKVALLEEREPLGKSDNFIKMLKNLQDDNDNTYDAHNFLKARMIDLLFCDWDRHGDQWRFRNQNKKGEGKDYIAIPRDRDMVLNVTEGLLPTLLKRFVVMPHVRGFNDNVVGGAKYYLYKSTFLNAHPASQLSHEDYTKTVKEFQEAITDSVLEASVNSLPVEIQKIRNGKILHDLKSRRNKLPEAMERYYKFSNSIVDIHTSNKNELILIKDVEGQNALQITVRKISKKGNLEDTLMSKIYPHSITKQIRIYIGKGDDSVVVDNKSSNIKLRIIGGKGDKAYNIIDSKKHIPLYDREEESYYGESNILNKHLNDDSVQTAFVPVNLYNTFLPLLTASYNLDDGIFLGAGIRYTRQRGFRKSPSSIHQLMISHAFGTEAFNIKYSGEWLKAFDNTDFIFNTQIKAPDNTQNFFGMGNETPFHKFDGFKKYYRARFDYIAADAGLRWHTGKRSIFIIGPSLQYYHFDKDDNAGRFIEHPELIGNYDSTIVATEKLHLGIAGNYIFDRRNNALLPSFGTYVNIRYEAYAGLNKYSKSYFQLQPEIALYKNLNAKQTIVVANRIGGGITLGQPAFYQALYLGGQGNLLGYRKYRFAGQQMLYNNLELRIAFSNFGNYILKGQLGIAGFYDVGRVWQKGENSAKWHNGIGAGLYFAPAYLAVFRVDAAYSEEGWYPTFTMGFRF